jgi:hypothetical protein
MRKEKRICIRILHGILCCVLLFSNPPTLSYADQTEPRNISTGITYLSTHWHYEPYYLSDAEIHRDFRLFRDNGLSIVTLVTVWKYIEPSPGVYNDEAIDDIIHICEIADEYNLQIIIDFHTMMQLESFTMPEWMNPRKFEQVFRDQKTREAWLNYLDHCVDILCEVDNIHSWHMMNEPARSLYPDTDNWACNASIDMFVELWWEMRSIFKTYSNKPVSIRFGGDTFDKHFERDSRIYQVCDYVALNWYEEFCSRELLTDMVSDIQDYVPVMISEFGFETDDDSLQEVSMVEYLDLFDQVYPRSVVAWYWRADYENGSPEAPGLGFNLAGTVEGSPRPAFNILCIKEYPNFVIPESTGGTLSIVIVMIVSLFYSRLQKSRS